MSEPFYNPSLSYQENYDFGPFGPILNSPSPAELHSIELAPDRWVQLAGIRLRRPSGIPSGPLLNSNFTGAAFRWGFDLLHYKTVRTRRWPSHPAPNVLRVDAPRPIAPDELGKHELRARPFNPGEPVDLATLSITNSFGMPAQDPTVWQADMERAARGAGPGQALFASVTGTVGPDATAAEFVEDHARAAAMCAETGVSAVEVNLSCPNLGGHGLLCHDAEGSAAVCRGVRSVTGNLPLFAKIGTYAPTAAGDAALKALVSAVAPFIDGFSAVNAVPVPITAEDGSAALPGAGRNVAGVCGAALKATGLNVVRRLARMRTEGGYDFVIIGVGGLASAEDYQSYRDAGADAVQGATGPMWNHRLAVEIAMRSTSHALQEIS